MTEALHLPAHVFFCVAQGHGIFLDLKQDAYSAIPPPTDQTASESCGNATRDLLAALVAPHQDELLEAGLLTRDSETTSPLAAYLDIDWPDAHVFGADDVRAFGLPAGSPLDRRVGFRDTLDFFVASWRAARHLKRRHISDIVHAVRRRKASAHCGPPDLAALRVQTAIFRKLRPWYPRAYLCLFDALALLEFLARKRLHPDWIFGVQAQPFGAHCWLQTGSCLLNENTEYANQFTPIMLV